MDTTHVRVAGLVVSAAAMFVSGFRLSRLGRPYGTALLTVHKLVALAAVSVVGMMAYQANRVATLYVLESTVIVATVLLAIATFASGGIVSANESALSWILWLHLHGSSRHVRVGVAPRRRRAAV